MPQPRTGTAICLITDLFFVAKVEAPLKALGLRVEFAQSGPAFIDAIRKLDPVLAILHLGAHGVDPIALIGSIRADESTRGVSLLCFGDHVNAPLLEGAKIAGADDAITNGQFFAHLPTIVSEYLDS